MKYKDFDAMFAKESNSDSFGHIKIYGKIIDFRKEVPVIHVLEYMRGARKDVKYYLEAASNIFGKEVIESLCENKGFCVDVIVKMVEYAMSVISGQEEDNDDEELTEDDFGTVKKPKN